MKQLKVILAILAILILLLLPMAALADNAAESELAFNLEWGEGINANFSHSTWYANDRHWVALVYEGDVWVTSTADYGASWDSSKLVDEGNTTFNGLATWYDEPNDIVHMARVAAGNTAGNVTDVVYHSSYVPAASGLMATVEGEVAVEDGTFVDGDVISVTIACDEQGYPWIAWVEEEFPFAGNMTGRYWVETSDSDTNDGTWVELNAYGFYEFDSSGAAVLGHDYDALYGAGNWTAIAVSLCPVSATGNLMQLAWSIEDKGADADGDAGIDATIYNESTDWGNLTWVVPMHDTQGLYPYTIGEIAFSFYDSGSTIYAVYCDWIGHIMYNFKESGDSWNDVSGYGNWTMIAVTSGNIFPAIAGYEVDGPGEDLIVVYHNQDSLYYDIRPFGGSFTGTWTEIWDVSDHTVNPAHGIFLHSLQYKYGAGSPVGFAWDWGTLAWGNSSQTGTLDYWWIDQDGTDGGENPLGWYSSGVITSTWLTVLFKTLLSIAIACGIVIGTLKFEMAWQPKLVMIAMGLMLIAIVNSLL